MESLIVFRGIQGVGAGAIFPVSLAIIGDLFTPRERGRYQGLFGAVFGVAADHRPAARWLADGQPRAGTGSSSSTCPSGAVTLYIIYRYLPSVHGEPPHANLDYLGAAVFTVAVVFLLLGLTNKQTADWGDVRVGGFLLIAALLTPVFLFIESRAKEPIVPLELFRIRNYAVTILATFLAVHRLLRRPSSSCPAGSSSWRASAPPNRGSTSCRCWPASSSAPSWRGAMVSRTGRFKWVVTALAGHHVRGPPAVHRPGRPRPTCPLLWGWMFITGLGVGPTLSRLHHRHPGVRAIQPPWAWPPAT